VLGFLLKVLSYASPLYNGNIVVIKLWLHHASFFWDLNAVTRQLQDGNQPLNMACLQSSITFRGTDYMSVKKLRSTKLQIRHGNDFDS